MEELLIIFFASKAHIIIAGTGVIYFLFASRAVKIKLMLLGAVMLPVSYIVGKTAGLLFETIRPFVKMGISPLVEHVADNGFPSEHTLYALIIAGVIFTVHRSLGIILATLGVAVGIARILAFVHNPIDIIGSAAIALLLLVIVIHPQCMRYVDAGVCRIIRWSENR